MLELVEYSDLKAYLGFEEASIALVPDLQLIRESVYYAIESYLNRVLENQTATEYHYTHQNGGNFIPLKLLPIVSIASVTENIAGTDTVLTEWNDYEQAEQGIVLKRNNIVSGKYSINYTGGYSQEEIPSAIKRAALLQTINEYEAKDNIGGTDIQNEGGIIKKKPIGLLAEVKRLLTPYKHSYYLT
jgi:hypothetical protein